MKLVVLSDIHANLEAFNAVLKDIESRNLTSYKMAILGDTINYGLRPNETVDIIRKLSNLDVLLAGNHEMALLGVEDDRFSSTRGKEILLVTKKILNNENIKFINNNYSKTYIEKTYDNKKYLFIHGSLEDKYWGTIKCKNEQSLAYKPYDIVISGHSHKPHFFEVFYEVSNPQMRNKKRTIFINTGSVGQPRNHSAQAQYVIVDTVSLEITFCKVEYNIEKEQSIYDNFNVDEFYKNRIGAGV